MLWTSVTKTVKYTAYNNQHTPKHLTSITVCLSWITSEWSPKYVRNESFGDHWSSCRSCNQDNNLALHAHVISLDFIFLSCRYCVLYYTIPKNDTDVYSMSTDSDNFWHKCCSVSKLSNNSLFSHLIKRMSLLYLGKHEPRKLWLFHLNTVYCVTQTHKTVETTFKLSRDYGWTSLNSQNNRLYTPNKT